MQRIREGYRELCEFLEDLRSLPQDALILVEGPKDESSLRELGITTPVAYIHSSTPLYQKVKGFQEVIILTDYDREGRHLARRSQETIRSVGVRPNLEFRRRLRKASMGEISHIEGLHTYFANLGARALSSR